MERIFLRQRQEAREMMTPERYRIGVTGLGQSVGATFIATALAFYFRDQGRSVSYTECLNPAKANHIYFDQVAMDKRFALRTFHDIYQKLVEDLPFNHTDNIEEQICWRLSTPQNGEDQLTLTDRQKARLVAAAYEEVCIFDMEADYGWDDFLVDMDVIFVVVDPLPSKMIRSRKRYRIFKKMEISGCNVVWIVNKMNAGVDKKQVKNYLKSDKILWLDAIAAEEIYGDEYRCRFHWENEEIQRKIKEFFTKVSRKIASLSWFSI